MPVIGKDFYEFKGEFATAQAVTPGQGQTVNVAGVRSGRSRAWTCATARRWSSMQLDEGEVTVHRDAKMLLRPKTGLKDMVVELDPGTADAPELREGSTIPVAATQPDVNLDELLSSLDGDTRTYLQAAAERPAPAACAAAATTSATRSGRSSPTARLCARSTPGWPSGGATSAASSTTSRS